ncbi:hypothetical protein L873DRAFT_1822297 [Choiromyces venosus 120613-1]|uniref:Uncharacterized protein n=1 Tax=Choiromyces venosus 120613-1 TaxID=1336337 RepID=A0A3N4IUB3_9PEZI|nr:hypothetical protein L873DRAFT_1822297 [Choiromyces venosus 120613-1]
MPSGTVSVFLFYAYIFYRTRVTLVAIERFKFIFRHGIFSRERKVHRILKYDMSGLVDSVKNSRM